MDVSSCLQFLSAKQPCLERWSTGRSSMRPPAQMPIFVAHAARLRRRREHIEMQLQKVGAEDVTFVLCADADVVAGLDPAIYTCLHPGYTKTYWSRPGVARLPNGTLSLALKHRLAHAEAARRKLRAALIIEDDAVLPLDLWSRLSEYTIPTDASIFFLGSYSRSLNPKLTLASSQLVLGTQPPVHRRHNGSTGKSPPHILGTVAYLLLEPGARALHNKPVRAESDVDLSLLAPTAWCGPTSPECAVAAPPAQYGPARWLIWQDESLSKELTHGRANSVRDGWVRACRGAMARADQKLQRSCRKFGVAM